MKANHFFTKTLLRWHDEENFRVLPWKEEKDAYRIWLSEIILQQTRAEQGLPYYLKFTEAYPSINDLAAAKDEEVFRLWQGLGYYNRCKNLLFTARFIAGELEGKFPQDYEQILKLKGVGSYTAAAIASFAFDLPHAVVDGNVHRVLARYFGIETSIDSSDGKKLFLTLANELLDKKNSAAYNQAIMDLGATVCKPQKSLCKACPLKEKCFAYEKEMTELLPVKSKKIKVKKRALRYYILKCNEYVYIQKRMAKDIWQNLYEPLLLEEESGVEEERLTTFHFKTKPKEIGASTQRLTHQLITAQFYFAELKKQEIINENGRWVIVSELENYAFPKTIVSFFKKIKLLLDD